MQVQQDVYMALQRKLQDIVQSVKDDDSVLNRHTGISALSRYEVECYCCMPRPTTNADISPGLIFS